DTAAPHPAGAQPGASAPGFVESKSPTKPGAGRRGPVSPMLAELLPAPVACVEALGDQPAHTLLPEEPPVLGTASEGRRRDFTAVRPFPYTTLFRSRIPPLPILPGPNRERRPLASSSRSHRPSPVLGVGAQCRRCWLSSCPLRSPALRRLEISPPTRSCQRSRRCSAPPARGADATSRPFAPFPTRRSSDLGYRRSPSCRGPTGSVGPWLRRVEVTDQARCWASGPSVADAG